MIRSVIKLFSFSGNKEEIPEALLPCDWRYDGTEVTNLFVDHRILGYVEENGMPLHGICELTKKECTPIGCTKRDLSDLCDIPPEQLTTQLRDRR